MDLDTQTLTLVAVVSGGIGVLATKTYEFFLARGKQQDDQELTLIAILERRVSAMEAKHDQCQKEHTATLVEMGELRGQVGVLKGLVCPFPQAHSQSNQAVAQQQAG